MGEVSPCLRTAHASTSLSDHAPFFVTPSVSSVVSDSATTGVFFSESGRLDSYWRKRKLFLAQRVSSFLIRQKNTYDLIFDYGFSGGRRAYLNLNPSNDGPLKTGFFDNGLL
jgi:hypothetical protein